ncbi:MAG: TatD family hydrolase [Pseudomonadales bacterium]|nr:TatD family hydrolase [Pseudomonadales bacterium]
MIETPTLFDIGVNLLHPQFDVDREDVLARARDQGVAGMLVTSTSIESTIQNIAYCQPRGLHCTAGIHPHDASGAGADFAETLLALARAPCVKAIGETGLDFNRNFSPAEVQRSVFSAQIEVAIESRLPLFVHDRDSAGETAERLAGAADRLSAVVVHCFTGTEADLSRYLALGFCIGITGWICDRRRGGRLRELVTRIPIDALLIETDAPFLLPGNTPADWHATHAVSAPRRRNEPALLHFVVEEIARLRRESPAFIAEQTRNNALRLLQIPEPG